MNDKVIYEDGELLVCVKPSGVPSQSDRTGDYDMVCRMKNHVHQQNPEKGEPYIAVINRLDRPVGGLLLFAKTPEAAADLSKAVKERCITKKYLTVLSEEQPVTGQDIRLTDFLLKDGRTNLSRLVSGDTKGAKKGELIYRVREVKDEMALVEVELLTGRHHQIRAQMAGHLGGIWGDTKYNKKFQQKRGWYEIALYSYYLAFEHPRTKERMVFTHLPEKEPFTHFSIQCG